MVVFNLLTPFLFKIVSVSFVYFWLYLFRVNFKQHSPINKHYTTLSNGYLGSPIDEERSEMRYVMRIAEFSESSNL